MGCCVALVTSFNAVAFRIYEFVRSWRVRFKLKFVYLLYSFVETSTLLLPKSSTLSMLSFHLPQTLHCFY